jgi:hypothetical protein
MYKDYIRLSRVFIRIAAHVRFPRAFELPTTQCHPPVPPACRATIVMSPFLQNRNVP